MIEQGFNLPWALALVLAFPMAILANLFTPFVRAWWLRRPERSVAVRIRSLERKVAAAERVLSRHETVERYLLAEIVHAGAFAAMQLTVLSLAFAVMWVALNSSPPIQRLFPALLCLGLSSCTAPLPFRLVPAYWIAHDIYSLEHLRQELRAANELKKAGAL